jgi:hypothetical protein
MPVELAAAVLLPARAAFVAGLNSVSGISAAALVALAAVAWKVLGKSSRLGG